MKYIFNHFQHHKYNLFEVWLKQVTWLESQVFGEHCFAPFSFYFLFSRFVIVARRGSILDGQNVEGEQNVFPLTIRPNQSLLVEELKSKFENIDRRFDSLFEHINNNGNVDPPPKTVVSNPDSQVICKQISDV